MNTEIRYGKDQGTLFIEKLYAHLLKRKPNENELIYWSEQYKSRTPLDILEAFVDSIEYKSKTRVRPFYPIGHYYSPIVDPDTVTDYVVQRRDPGPDGFGGIKIKTDIMNAFWDRNKSVISNSPFPDFKSDGYRFFYDGAPFPYGDAATLHAMIGEFRPKHIVEIGSGFSTACMLDSADAHGLRDLKITCVEPYPDRLNSLLWPADRTRVELHETFVQNVPVDSIVSRLHENDILFIDSSHVVKTGSDVCYEIFDILPRLRTGVMIHIHDCQYPFEYPQDWISQNWSWNEIYGIRAFLMFNTSFEIFFWGSLFAHLNPQKVVTEGGKFRLNRGGSLWIRKVG